jgi:hypothetical protein
LSIYYREELHVANAETNSIGEKMDIKLLGDVEFDCETEELRMKLELERLLFEENNATLKLNEDDIERLRIERISAEKELEAKQKQIS